MGRWLRTLTPAPFSQLENKISAFESNQTFRTAVDQPHSVFRSFPLNFSSFLGVDTDELDSNVDDWEEETVEFFINEEIITVAEAE